VAHVSGGDPSVYGKSDLIFKMAEEDDATDIPIEIVPSLTAALGGSANVGAPLCNDFCTVSLSDKWRGWDEIEEKLRAAAISDFVIVLYNCWRNYEKGSTSSARSEPTTPTWPSPTTPVARTPAATVRASMLRRSERPPTTTTRCREWAPR